MRDRSHEDAMAEMYARDPEVAIGVIDLILEDGSQMDCMVVIRQLAKSSGEMQEIAGRHGVPFAMVNRSLSAEGVPPLATLQEILRMMAAQLALSPVKAA